MLEWNQCSLPAHASSHAFNIQLVYEVCLVIGVFVCFVVLFFMRAVIFNSLTCLSFSDCGRLEVFWSFLPFIFLVGLCGVSVVALYSNDETNKDPLVDIVVVGHQWYWSYQVCSSDYLESVKWDSRMVPRSSSSDLSFVDYSMVDKPLPVPVGGLIRVLVTSEDVLHSWGAPRLLLKVDAIPGRLTRGLFELVFPGIINGMCVELCGAYHFNMPTVIEGVSHGDFLSLFSK